MSKMQARQTSVVYSVTGRGVQSVKSKSFLSQKNAQNTKEIIAMLREPGSDPNPYGRVLNRVRLRCRPLSCRVICNRKDRGPGGATEVRGRAHSAATLEFAESLFPIR